jgi:hypothetical protein
MLTIAELPDVDQSQFGPMAALLEAARFTTK